MLLHMVICETHILTNLHKRSKCDFCTEWCAKACGCKLWIQLYLSMQSCLLQPSFCHIVLYLPTTTYQPTHPCMPVGMLLMWPVVLGGCEAWTRWFVPWLQLERPIHPQRRLSANFKPPSCYFITVNLVIFISGHSDYYNCHAIYSKDIWCPLLSLGYRMTRGWAPATLHFGRIIDSGNFQPSSKLCRFAGTKVNSKIPHNWLLFATGSGNSVDLCWWSKPVCQIFNSLSKPWHSE